MSAAAVAIIVAVVTVVGALVGAAFSAWLNRDRDDADTAEKISAAWSPAFERMDKDLARLERRANRCDITLDKALAINDATLNAFDRFVESTRTGPLTQADYTAVHDTIQDARRSNRELREMRT